MQMYKASGNDVSVSGHGNGGPRSKRGPGWLGWPGTRLRWNDPTAGREVRALDSALFVYLLLLRGVVLRKATVAQVRLHYAR